MRYSNEHKQETRNRVLQEAAREIRAKGPNNIAVAGVMARAGLTHGGFYAHFDSKDALVAEAIGTMFADARLRWEEIDTADHPQTTLRKYVDFYLSHAHRDARERGCPLPALSGDFARSKSNARTRFSIGVERLTGLLATALGATGVANAADEASAMLAQMVGAVVLARALDGPASDAILAAARSAIIAKYHLEKTQ